VLEIGAYEVKTHLPKLLARVARGERFIITRHGLPVAELGPLSKRSSDDIQAAIEGLKAFQAKHQLDGLSIRELIEEGRRH
jgi:prevent-host-death family protein